MNFQSVKRSFVSVFRNIPGKSVGRKIVVIEADDWGSVRMPSREAFTKLVDAGIPVDKSRYGRNDALESGDDMEALFSVLKKHKDKDGKSAVISPFCNMANPDFEAIKANNYSEYEYETFTDTYSRYNRNGIMKVWEQGIKDNVFVPQFHGREHIATDLWLKVLQKKDRKVEVAFDHQYASYSPPCVPRLAKDFRPSFYVDADGSLQKLRGSLEEGIDIFNHAFGFLPTVFNAPNAVFVPEFNSTLMSKGVKFSAVPRKRLDRSPAGSYEYTTYSTGQKSPEGLTYYVRNCNFEPSETGYQGVDHVLNQINGAFLCKKAAIVGTHRVNFVGGFNQANRKQGLAELDSLLKQIVQRWPDVEFMSSKEFSELL